MFCGPHKPGEEDHSHFEVWLTGFVNWQTRSGNWLTGFAKLLAGSANSLLDFLH